MRTPAIVLWILCTFALSSAPPASAQWQPGGLPITEATGPRTDLASAPDGEGGTVSVWVHESAPGVLDIRVQRLGECGTRLWGSDGVLVGEQAPGPLHGPSITGDGAGGAWVAWPAEAAAGGERSDILLQHVNAGGIELFDPPVMVSSNANVAYHRHPRVERGGFGGAIVVWAACTTPYLTPTVELTGQRVTAGGALAWAPTGVEIGTLDQCGGFLDTDACLLSGGGLYVAWGNIEGYLTVQSLRADGTKRYLGSSVSRTFYGIAPFTVEPRIAARQFGNGGFYLWAPMPATTSGMRAAIAYGDSANILGVFSEAVTPPTTHYGNEVDLTVDNFGGVALAYAVSGHNTTVNGVGVWLHDPFLSRDWRVRVSDTSAGETPAAAFSPATSLTVAWIDATGGTPALMYDVGDGANGIFGSDRTVAGAEPSEPPLVIPDPTSFGSSRFLVWLDDRDVTEDDPYAAGIAVDGELLMADLRVLSVDLSSNPSQVGEVVTADVQFVNEGNCSTGSFHVGYYCDESTPPEIGDQPDAGLLVPSGLDAGEQIGWVTNVCAGTVAETWQSYVFVDRYGVVPESDETDNLFGPFEHVWEAMADLAITSFTLSTTTPAVGDLVTAQIEITNLGNAPSDPCVLDFYRNRSSAPGWGETGDQRRTLGSMFAGESTVWTTGAYTHDTFASWQAWVLVDTEEQVVESDEDNNLSGPRGLTWRMPECEGWPVSVDSDFVGSPALCSLPVNPPGLRSVVAVTEDGRLHAWDGLGRAREKWPVTVGGPKDSSPAVGNVVGDAVEEIVASDPAGLVWIVDADGASYTSCTCPGTGVTSPLLVDLNGDGLLEIVVGDASGRVSAFKGTGTMVSGWPIVVSGAVTAPVASADVDGNGSPELVVCSLDTKNPGNSNIYLLRADGSDYSAAWPRSVSGYVAGGAAIGNIGGSADLEIAVGTSSAQLHLFSPTLSAPGFPVALVGPVSGAVTLGDLDADGTLEMLLAGDYQVGAPPFTHLESFVYAVDADASVLSGWPQALTSPLVNSQSSEGQVVWGPSNTKAPAAFIAIGSANGWLGVADQSGDPVVGLSVSHGSSSPIRGSAAVGDLDADDECELLVATPRAIHAYDLLGHDYDPSSIHWAMGGADARRTHSSGTVTPTDVPPEVASARTRLLAPRPNPFNPRVTIFFELAREGRAQLEFFDTAGRRVRTLDLGIRPEGPSQVDWAGRDDRGRSVASGVYHVKLVALGTEDVRRVVLVR